MCGIVGAVSERNVVPTLVEGLRRLEYRGYDSAGLVVINGSDTLTRVRTPGKVAALDELLENESVQGSIGIAHTRWATHGVPNEANAHPHVCRDEVAVVHNGIIENYAKIRAEQESLGYEFQSDTDTEVIATRVHYYLGQGATLVDAVRSTTSELEAHMPSVSSMSVNRIAWWVPAWAPRCWLDSATASTFSLPMSLP